MSTAEEVTHTTNWKWWASLIFLLTFPFILVFGLVPYAQHDHSDDTAVEPIEQQLVESRIDQ